MAELDPTPCAVDPSQAFSTNGDELWVVNGHSHSVTIITAVGTAQQGALTRTDRGYYHYFHNVTAISFNTVDGSGFRAPSRDTFAYFATCQDSNNTYLGLKEPNYFMGPSLYNSDPAYKNLVSKSGERCDKVPPLSAPLFSTFSSRCSKQRSGRVVNTLAARAAQPSSIPGEAAPVVPRRNRCRRQEVPGLPR